MSDRQFTATPAVRGDDPLLIALLGPPGAGKTKSALRMAEGIKSVRGGDIVLIDTEGGRAKKYADAHQFLHVPFDPPFRPADFLVAIKQQIARKPACIIVDSGSDEHAGEGGYLSWHDEQVGKVGGNEWAAWAKPSASRTALTTGLLRIKVPMIWCFRAKEKTAQKVNDRGRKEVINIGYQPIAPAEIIHTMDLTCILPAKANGVPVWHSDKIGEDFVLKLPEFLRPLIVEGAQLDERLGAALERWRQGGRMQNEPQTKGAANAAQNTPTGQQPAAEASGAEGGPAASQPASAAPGRKIGDVADEILNAIRDAGTLDEITAAQTKYAKEIAFISPRNETLANEIAEALAYRADQIAGRAP